MRLLLVPVLSGLLLAGCGQGGTEKVQGLDKLGSISAVTREADSGTRATFDDVTDIINEGDGIKEAGSTEDVLKAVGEDAGAIGYLTGEAADDSVKILDVEGKKISDKKYPLTRQLYLANKSPVSDLEQDFITFVTGKGQDIVKEDFEPVGKSVSFLSMKPVGTLKIGGSSSEAPIMEKLAQAYMKENPKAKVTVETNDSGTGINGALEGTYDLGMSSRKPKSYEKSLLKFTPVAQDRIAVIVGKENPLTSITLDQLKSIYTGEITKWGELYE